MSIPRSKTIYEESYRLLIEWLRTARETANVTQVVLAKRLRKDQSYVSKYERSERRLDVIELRAVCIALGLDFTEFITQFARTLQQRGL